MKPDSKQASRSGDRVSNARMRPLRRPRLLLYLVLVASLDNIIHLKFWLTESLWQAAQQSGDASSRMGGLNDRRIAATTSTLVQTHNKPRVVRWTDHHERHQPQWTASGHSSVFTLGKDMNNHTMELREPSQQQQRSYRSMPPPLCEPEDLDCEIPDHGSWQATNNMTCNPIHEIDLNDSYRLRIVAKGGKRFVWKYLDDRGSLFALKMFQYRADRPDDFGPMTIELQRRDALLHEVTASSPHIVNMHQYCGASALFDFGDGGQLEKYVKRNGAFYGNELLRIAHRIAASVADLHKPDRYGIPSVAHADIHGQQWVKVNGQYQLTDFNLAKMLKRSKKTNSTVPFRREVVDNWFSPEVHEQTHRVSTDIVTVASDVWNLGNVLYLLLTGQPPFDGLSRQEGHSLILQNQRPQIPERKRESNEPGDIAVLRAIDMCTKRNPEERATARQVADFLEDAWNSVVHDGRSSRFPSLEKRVKLYMTNWYAPPCGNYPNATNQYRFLSEDSIPQRKVLVRELKGLNASNSGYRVAKIVSKIGDDVAFIEPGMLHDLNLPHAGYRADVATTLLPLIESTMDETPPILMQFGDRVSLHIADVQDSESFSLPYFRKCRPIFAKGELERITSPHCYGREDRPRHESPVRPTPVHEPIIWKLDSHRLLDPIQEVFKADLPWRRKIDKAIFRGALTGHAFWPSSHLRLQRHHAQTDHEYCNAIDRCRFVLQNSKSSLVDARLTSLLDKRLNSTIDGVPLLGEKMDMRELLRYKVIIMLEGNDVSSGLRWALRSNSLVMMPPPTFTSWAMEELLEPWVHYVPIDPSFNNTESRMQWVQDHDEEAEKVASRGSLWIKDLLEHPYSEKENTLINKEILERYQRQFVRSDDLSLATESNNVISKTA